MAAFDGDGTDRSHHIGNDNTEHAMGRALAGETELRGERCKSAARRCDVEWHGASQQTSGREAAENEIGISPSRLVATSHTAGWSRSGPGTERAEYCTHVHSSSVTFSPR